MPFAIAETNSGLVSQGYINSVIVLMNEDRQKVEAAAEFMRKAVNNTGFAARIETVNTMDAYSVPYRATVLKCGARCRPQYP